MKRRVVRILLLLVAGAIVNVAVAWAFTFVVVREPTAPWERSTFVSHQRTPLWVMHEENGTGWQRLMWEPRASRFAWNRGLLWGVVADTPPRWTRFDWKTPPQPGQMGEAVEEAGGWPALSVRSLLPVTTVNSLQLRAIWPGFAINTLFYAGILWLLVTAPFALQRRFRGGRIKRGLCPACAYPIGEREVCTECGKAVRPKEITA